MFHLKDSNQYSLGNECEQCCCKPRNLKYSTETNLYLAPEIWSIVFKTLKENTSTDYFLKKKKWKTDCPCQICKKYLQHFSFA